MGAVAGPGLMSLAALAIALTAPAASAQEPGVHVDPSSPVGKEYAIPTDQARNQGTPSRGQNRPAPAPSSSGSSSGGSSSGGGSSDTAAPSEQGISQAQGASGQGSSTRRSAPKRRHRSPSARPKRAQAAASPRPALPAASDVGGGAGTPAILAIAVLVAGGLGGLAARLLVRRRVSA